MPSSTINPALLNGSPDAVGERSREAVAALGGFAYQLYASALAWLALKDGEDLHLEVAEDYAVATQDSLQGVQVRDTSSSALTLRSEGAVKAIDSLIALQRLNPQRTVTVRYLTTSPMGVERARADRAGPDGSLSYWRVAAAGGPVMPLRKVLNRLPLAADSKTFIAHSPDEELRRTLLARLFWDCGQLPIDHLRGDLADGLAEFVRSALGLPSDVSLSLQGRVLERVLEKASDTSERRLRRADLLKLGEQAGMLLVPRSTLMMLGGGAPGSGAGILQSGTQVGRLAGELKREEIITNLGDMLSNDRLAAVVGSTGTGKTALARAAAVERGDAWHLADFRDLTPDQTAARLDLVTAELLGIQSRTLILDDVGHLALGPVITRLERLMTIVRRKDASLILTAAVPPPPSALGRLSKGTSLLEAPYFTRDEVEELVARSGGRRQQGAAIWLAASGGHPQLTQAAIASLRAAGWNEGSEAGHSSPAEQALSAEREGARSRLIDALPRTSRTLLYRLSIVLGRFNRELALALGDTPPPVEMCGEAFDLLVGPWIEQLAPGEYRVSPLVANTGSAMLGAAEQQSLHRQIASSFIRQGGLSPNDADTLLHHGLAGGDNRQVGAFAIAVLRTSYDRLADLARYSTFLLYLAIDKPILDDPDQNASLRLAQFLVTAAGGSAARTVNVWQALQRETGQVRNPAHFELLILTKSLMVPGLANKLPGWLGLLERLVGLEEAPALVATATELRAAGFPGDFANFLFLMQAAGFNRVQQLRSLFDELDKMPPAIRHRLVGLSPREGNEAYYLTSVWLKEVGAADFDPRRTAQHYREMMLLASGWGERITALRCAAAGAVMLDEYAHDQEGGVDLLQSAEQLLGPDPILQRARAKIWWRQDDHGRALEQFEQLPLDALGDPVERAHAAREAGISAAALGRWDSAAGWFQDGAAAAASGAHEVLGAMAAGLTADAAQMEYRAGRHRQALDGYASALQQLGAIDPDGSLQGAHCHRVVRHAILWLVMDIKGEQPEAGGEFVLPAGACSNPSPISEIRNLPLGDLGLAWYLLAKAELLLEQDPLIDSRLEELSPGGLIESMEVQRIKAHIDDAVGRSNPEKAVEWLDRFVDMMRALRERKDELLAGDPTAMPRGSFGTARPCSWTDDDLAAVRNLLVDFSLAAAASGNAGAIAALSARLAGRNMAVDNLLQALAGEPVTAESDQWISETMAVLLGVSLSPAANLKALMHACFMLRRSDFRPQVEVPLATWACRRWQETVARQRFALRSPALAVPAIQAVLDCFSPNLGWTARLALAALVGVDLRLGEGVHEALVEIAATGEDHADPTGYALAADARDL